MANYANLKAAVNAAITTNGNNEITGAILNDILNSIISTIGGNYTFAGVVTPSTTISAPDANVFWIGGAGTYTQFGGTITIAEGNIGLFTYNGSYTRTEISISSWINSSIGYYECTSTLTSATKVVSATGYKQTIGGAIKIKFSNSASVDAYLQIGSVARYPLYYNGRRANAQNTWRAEDILYVYFDGTQYQAFNLNSPLTLAENVYTSNGDNISVALSQRVEGESINIYDKRVAGWLGYVSVQGGLNALANYESSYLIPIIEGEAYSFSSYPNRDGNCYLRIINSDGTPLVIQKEDGTDWGYTISAAASPKIFIAPVGAKYAQFTTKWNGSDYKDSLMLLRGKYYTLEEYIPYKPTISKDQLNLSLQEEIDSKASYAEVASKNLFDKTQVVEGKYIGYSAAGASSIGNLEGAAISGLIPIEEGETYYLYRPVQEGNAVPAFVRENGTTLMSAINPATNEIYSPYGSLAGVSAALKAPVGAKYFVFCIAFSGYEPSDCDGIQFEKGDHFTGYVDYYKKDVIPMEHLPYEVSNAMEKLTELGENVEELAEQINGEKPNHFHCSLTEDEKSFYSIPIAGNQNYSTFRQEFYIKRAGSLSYNPNFNLWRTGYAINNNSSGVGLLISGNSDDICPVSYGGGGMYSGYLGGNHGLDCKCVCTAAAHGKTYADIGSVYALAGHNYCIAQVVDADTIILLGENTLTYPIFKNADAAVGTYSHVSGGTNTGSIVVTAVTSTQLRPIISQPEVTVMVDGEVVTVGGEYECGYVDIIESYKIINPASLYMALVATVGTHSDNPLLNEIGGLEYCARITNKYRYQGKMCVVSTSLQVLQAVRPRFFGFAQYGPVTADSTKYVYIPNLLPYGGVDYRIVQSLDAVSGQITASAEYWESGKVPSRLVEYAERGGFHACFLPDYGFGGEIDGYTTQAFYIYTTKKYYPQPLFGHDSKDTYSLVSVKAYLERADINHDGIIQQSVFEYNGELYIFADFNASGEYRISVQDKYIGHNIVTFDKTSNVTLSGDIAMNELVIDVSVATPMYGYFCGKISK